MSSFFFLTTQSKKENFDHRSSFCSYASQRKAHSRTSLVHDSNRCTNLPPTFYHLNPSVPRPVSLSIWLCLFPFNPPSLHRLSSSFFSTGTIMGWIRVNHQFGTSYSCSNKVQILIIIWYWKPSMIKVLSSQRAAIFKWLILIHYPSHWMCSCLHF